MKRKQKMYLGSALVRREPKAWAQVIGGCFLLSLITGLIMVAFVM